MWHTGQLKGRWWQVTSLNPVKTWKPFATKFGRCGPYPTASEPLMGNMSLLQPKRLQEPDILSHPSGSGWCRLQIHICPGGRLRKDKQRWGVPKPSARKGMEAKSLEVPDDHPLPGSGGQSPMPFTMVGYAAFPLKTYLMRPFPGADIPRFRWIFSLRLSCTRMVVVPWVLSTPGSTWKLRTMILLSWKPASCTTTWLPLHRTKDGWTRLKKKQNCYHQFSTWVETGEAGMPMMWGRN